MKAAGIREFGAAVELLELPEPRALRPDEVLIDVRACGMGNWDEMLARVGHGAPGSAVMLLPGIPAEAGGP